MEQLDEEVVSLVEEVIGDSRKATHWLFRKHRLLGMSPAEYLNNGHSRHRYSRYFCPSCMVALFSLSQVARQHHGTLSNLYHIVAVDGSSDHGLMASAE